MTVVDLPSPTPAQRAWRGFARTLRPMLLEKGVDEALADWALEHVRPRGELVFEAVLPEDVTVNVAQEATADVEKAVRTTWSRLGERAAELLAREVYDAIRARAGQRGA